MYVNKILFLVTISRGIKFGTVEPLKRRDAAMVCKGIHKVTAFHRKRGFLVTTIHSFLEFEAVREDLLSGPHPITLNTASQAEHVPEIERYIRTIKERVRCIWNTMPFTSIPILMIVELVNCCVFWLNSYPVNDGVSKYLSPRNIVVGTSIGYGPHCQLEFGCYVQTHEEHDNSMSSRTTGAIALRPTGNAQGSYYFLSLSTGRRLNRHKWTALPIPNEVIDRVHALARRSRADRGILSGWRDGTPIENENDDDNYNNDDDDDDDDDGHYQEPDNDTDDNTDVDDVNDEAKIAGVSDSDDSDNENDNNEIDLPVPDDQIPGVHDLDDIAGVNGDEDDSDNENDLPAVADEADEEAQLDGDNIEEDISEMDLKYGARRHNINLRDRTPRSYDHRYDHEASLTTFNISFLHNTRSRKGCPYLVSRVQMHWLKK